RWSPDPSRFVWGATAVLGWSTFQLQSVVFGAATIFPLVLLWALLAFQAALNATEPRRSSPRWLLGAAVAAIAAALTTTNGLVVPLIVAWLLWARRARIQTIAAFASATAIGLALYLIFVATAVAASPLPAPSAMAMLGFFLAFFGTALGY